MIVDLTKVLPKHKTKVPALRKKIKRIVVHTTDWVVSPQELATYDIGPNHISETGCPTITYHYLIEQSGRINKTADHEVVTWHVGNWNRGSLGIALVYKTDKTFERAIVKNRKPPALDEENKPSGKMFESLISLLVDVCITETIVPKKIVGHRELSGTGWFNDNGSKRLRKTCPGMSVSMLHLRQRVAIALQRRLQELGTYTGEIDGDFGKKSKKALLAAK